MVGEKVIENELNKSIMLIIYEDTINNIDKYGKETVTTNTGTGQSYSSTSFKTYKILESNQYYECESVDELIAKEYGLHAYAAPVFLVTLGLIVLDYFLFHTGHWFWGIISSMFTLVIPVCMFWLYKCPKEYEEIISFIYKAMHQLRDKGKQLTK